MRSDDEQRQMVQQRLMVLAAVDDALRRHGEVLPLISAAADRQAARDAVRTLLGIEEIAAVAVLDLQWSHLTAAHRAVIAGERAKLEAFLGSVGPSDRPAHPAT